MGAAPSLFGFQNAASARQIATTMTRTAAAALYFAIVFIIAFGLGTLRVLLAAPTLGAFLATAIEVPILLAVSWWAAASTTSWLAVPAKAADRALVGLFAFALLMGVETLLGAFVFGRSLSAQLAGYSEPAGVLGLAGQIGFAVIPWLQTQVKR